jgi:hypothetical protein
VSLLVPFGWFIEGGAIRLLDPNRDPDIKIKGFKQSVPGR